jgi:hypothetical protein
LCRLGALVVAAVLAAPPLLATASGEEARAHPATTSTTGEQFQTVSGGVTFENIADDGVGLSFARVRSPEFALLQQIELRSLTDPLTFTDFPEKPEMTGGFAGVAIWDYDLDGDLDIYASNGPGAANGLFQNQLAQTGELHFVDVAVAAGVAAVDQDSSGVCAADIDNDGDPDLAVMGRHAPNRLFENRGDGTFEERAGSGIDGGLQWTTSCTWGDVDGDGLVDLFVANNGINTDAQWIYQVPFALNQPNELYLNNGDGTFTDVSATSGIRDLTGFGPGLDGSPTVTWASTMVDVDLDGDVDIVHSDDQAAFPPADAGGIDRGLIQVLINDGTGHFTSRPHDVDERRSGPWMGLAFGDLDCNGTLDLWASNFGDYSFSLIGQVGLGRLASRWLLGRGDGTFDDPGVGDEVVATPFSWGAAVFDYDADGDLDILSHGGLDASVVVTADNPGLLLQNQGCSAEYRIDFDAIPDDPTCTGVDGNPIPNCTLHTRRNVRGVAVGDLDGNGFADVVTLANVVSAPPLLLLPLPVDRGAPLDDLAMFAATFIPQPNGSFIWSGSNPGSGDLAVELNSGNRNRSATVRAQGSIGLTPQARVNRDGIGAVLSFTPLAGKTTLVPVTAGTSHLSQHAQDWVFGLGNRPAGQLEVLWPGGVRNRLYQVRHGEQLVMPEIPCSFDTDDPLRVYLTCVTTALADLRDAGVIDRRMRARLFGSALRAYLER